MTSILYQNPYEPLLPRSPYVLFYQELFQNLALEPQFSFLNGDTD